MTESNAQDIPNAPEEESGNEYQLKYNRLLPRCDAIKSDNDRLLNHIYEVKKLLSKYKKQRRLLMHKLDKHKDNYRNSDLALFPVDEPNNVNSTVKNSKGKVIKVATTVSKAKKSNKCDSKSSLTPKKPINPYLLYCQDNRSSVQERYQLEHNVEISNQELTKTLAQNWQEISLYDKQVYYSLYEREKERYEQELKIFATQASKKSVKVEEL